MEAESSIVYDQQPLPMIHGQHAQVTPLAAPLSHIRLERNQITQRYSFHDGWRKETGHLGRRTRVCTGMVEDGILENCASRTD